MSLKLSKKQREELRMKFGGRCAYCGCQLPEKGWHADHVKAVYRELEIDRDAGKQGQFKLKQTGDVYKPNMIALKTYFHRALHAIYLNQPLASISLDLKLASKQNEHVIIRLISELRSDLALFR